MKMEEITSRTWRKIAEVKTKAKTPKGIYKVLCREFGVDFYEDALAVEASINDGYIEICDDGFILWYS